MIEEAVQGAGEATAAKQAESLALRLRWDRQMRNNIKLASGYVVGKLAFLLVLIVVLPGAIGAAMSFNLAGFISESWSEVGSGVVIVLATLLFLRYGLLHVLRPSCTDEKLRKWDGARGRVVRRVLAIIMAALFAVAIAVGVWVGGHLALLGLVPFLGGVAGATLWAGWRWRSGDQRVCARCDYPQPPNPGPVCPECGRRWLERWGTTLGEPRVNRRVLLIGVACLGVVGVIIAIALLVPLR